MNRLMDRDILTAGMLFVVGGIFWSSTGDDVKDWIFPLLATYVVLSIGVLLVLRVIFAAVTNKAAEIVRMTNEDRVVSFDVLVFFLIVLAYMFVMYGLGFWLASFLMLSLTSLYLTLEKTRRNVMLATVVPLATCIVTYFVFLHIFYVPFPKATWWPGLT